MRCIDLISAADERGGKPLVVSLVGGGGKTSLMFALASELRAEGMSVLVTTTTRILDPRDEGRAFDALYLDESWAPDASVAATVPLPMPMPMPTPATATATARGSGAASGRAG